MYTKPNVREVNSVRVNRPVPPVHPALLKHEMEVYSVDPTGGQPSRY